MLSSLTPVTSTATATAPITPSIPPHKILYAYRLGRGDLKGAAACLWTRLQTLELLRRQGGGGTAVDDEVAETYLALINALSLVEVDDAWILTRPPPVVVNEAGVGAGLSGKLHALGREKEKDDASKGKGKAAPVREKRKVLTLADIRRLWQVELDRQADFQAGRFPVGLLGGGGGGGDADEMDVDDVFA